MITTPEDIRMRMVGGSEETFSDELINVKIVEVEDSFAEAIQGFDAQVQSGEIPEARVVRIVSRIIIGHLQNPQGYRTIQDTQGSYSSSVTLAGDMPGSLFISNDDIREMIGKSRSAKQSVFTISTLPERFW